MNLQERKAQREKQAELDLIEDSIISMLPDDLATAPTISNVKKEPRATDPVAWLSFSGPSYDPDKTWNPVGILQSLERAGFEQLPATLCKWGDYRRSPCFGMLESMPEEKRGSFGRMEKLTDCTPIAPLWFKPCQYTNGDVGLNMKAPDGRIFAILIDVPHVVNLSARRHEVKGGWHYERGTATVRFPQAWHGHEYCTISEHTRAYVDTEQGISGNVYFMPHGEQAEWPMKASEFLASLLAPEIK